MAEQALYTILNSHPGILLLPMEPLLANQGELAALLSAAALPSSSKTTIVVVTEGILSVAHQLMDKIRR